MQDGDSISRNYCQQMIGHIKSPLRLDSTLNACAVIHFPESTAIQVNPNIFSMSDRDSIEIWDGSPDAEPTLARVFTATDFNSAPVEIYSGTLTAVYKIHTVNVTLVREMTLNWVPIGLSLCEARITSFNANNITSRSATLHWQSSTNSIYRILFGDEYQVIAGNNMQLDNLTPNTDYEISFISTNDLQNPCCTQTFSFHTDAEATPVCPDMTDLHSTYAVCYAKNSSYLEERQIVDNGPQSILSQHTIHTDTAERDPRTTYRLRTVYPEADASVRLGNWNAGNEKESIIYYLKIDTNVYSMLLLHYAAVLQNAGHSLEFNPRFMLEILDGNNQVIDPECGVVDFIASSELGWNVTDLCLWKDWTSFGLDLAPYHGQEIHVRLSTRDCTAGAHFGYAYFCAECSHKSATSLHCGDVDSNTLSAPDGFLYQWYYSDPDNYFSTEQTINHETTDTIVYCRLISTEDSSCYIDISTAADRRYPVAEIDTVYITPNHCVTYDVQFVNHSHINYYNIDMGDNLEYCDAAKWYFGDGDSSTVFSPAHTYDTDGVYTVSLIASISGGECSDTITYLLNLQRAYHIAEDISACDSLVWRDGICYHESTTAPTYLKTTDQECDSLFHLHLDVRHSSRTVYATDTICSGQPFIWNHFSLPSDTVFTETMYYLADTLTNAEQCDSTVGIEVYRRAIMPITLSASSNCQDSFYILQATTDQPSPYWLSSPHDPSTDNSDGLFEILVNPASPTLYSVNVNYSDTPHCPSTADTILLPISFPTAKLKVNPEKLSYSNLEIKAYDISPVSDDRVWTIVNHRTENDTVILPDNNRNIVYIADSSIDSLTVILAVSNSICFSDTSRTLPFVKVRLSAPTAFTPGEESNNIFSIHVEGLIGCELTIYNRMGLLVYNSTTTTPSWDGTHNGIPCSQGAYVWHLRYRTIESPSAWNTAVGEVLLLR